MIENITFILKKIYTKIDFFVGVFLWFLMIPYNLYAYNFYQIPNENDLQEVSGEITKFSGRFLPNISIKENPKDLEFYFPASIIITCLNKPRQQWFRHLNGVNLDQISRYCDKNKCYGTVKYRVESCYGMTKKVAWEWTIKNDKQESVYINLNDSIVEFNKKNNKIIDYSTLFFLNVLLLIMLYFGPKKNKNDNI